jgi:hypothetical protein
MSLCKMALNAAAMRRICPPYVENVHKKTKKAQTHSFHYAAIDVNENTGRWPIIVAAAIARSPT